MVQRYKCNKIVGIVFALADLGKSLSFCSAYVGMRLIQLVCTGLGGRF